MTQAHYIENTRRQPLPDSAFSLSHLSADRKKLPTRRRNGP